MAKVSFDISMSLDGFVTAANRRPEEPMGDGGERLHAWAFNSEDERNQKILRGGAALGAVIAGRRTYDDSIPWWGPDGPTSSARIPVIVVSHSVPTDVPKGGVYAFANGIGDALAKAQATAGDKDISVMGGANIAQQFIKAGLLDEISIHLVPVLFGSGLRLFEHLRKEHIELEIIEVIDTKEATHLRYRVVQ
jgi:dihydrofolate reductase